MAKTAEKTYKEYAIEEFLVRDEPYYRPIGDEIEVFTAAYRQHIPVLLKGPTGCGKTRFVEYMAWQLGRPMATVTDKGGKKNSLKDGEIRVPLITIACHEDLTASDLVGRYLLDANGTRWI
ncbi:MAG: AAA family ATPase, partial [Chloroflexi bacterium]|nr:AAA family ATPase [Chloroflexota bacterium]